MKSVKEILGRNIKMRRDDMGLTQIDLAERAGLARQVITQIEGAQVWPTYATIEALAGALKVEAFRLFILEGSDMSAAVIEKLNETIELQESTIAALNQMKPDLDLAPLISDASKLSRTKLESLKAVARNLAGGHTLDSVLQEKAQKTHKKAR